MAVKIIGAEKLHEALWAMIRRIEDYSLITKQLARYMAIYAHVDTGYMKSTIYYKRNIAGASAPYAGFEADRGGEHDFAQKAIDAFRVDAYLGEIVEPF